MWRVVFSVNKCMFKVVNKTLNAEVEMRVFIVNIQQSTCESRGFSYSSEHGLLTVLPLETLHLSTSCDSFANKEMFPVKECVCVVFKMQGNSNNNLKVKVN